MSRLRVPLSVRLLSAFAVVAMLSMGTTAVLVGRSVRQTAFEEAEAHLRAQVTMTGQMTSGALFAPLLKGDLTLQGPITDLAHSVHTHLGLLAADGSIVADSELAAPADSPNQAAAAEVVAALHTGEGRAVRASADGMRLWIAKTIARDGVVLAIVRASLPIATIERQVARAYREIALAALLALALGGVTALAVALRIAQPVRRVAAAAKRIGGGELAIRVDLDRNDEIGELALALNDMATALARDRSQIERQNVALRRVFDTIDQGLIMVDRDGTLASEYSAQLARWFGAPSPGMRAWELFAGADERARGNLRLAIQAVEEASLPAALVLDQLPKRIQCGERAYKLAYNPVFESEDRVAQVLMTVTDVSEQREAERRELVQKSMIAIFERGSRDPSSVHRFLEEGSGLVGAVLDNNCSHDDALRYVHTLKGNSLMYGIGHIGHLCHELESQLQEGAPLTAEQQSLLLRSWDDLCKHVTSVLGDRDAVLIARSELAELARSMREGAPHATVVAQIEHWAIPGVESALQHMAEHARGLASRLEKGDVNVTCSSEQLPLHAEHATLWSSLVHAVRNAVDHGLETPQERRASGKSAFGTIHLRAFARGPELVIEVEDDGRGIRWERVAARMQQLGLATTSHEQLVEGLFVDGLSTAETMTATSGRGVGMSALRATVRELGGTIEIETESGRFTVLRCRVPMPQRLAPALKARVG